ncbi:MAG: DUF3153 domain-containing protein [Firmicutes bacterium]|nr:DUF3153 domain-containing protein [Bacillota bacterium]
MDGSKTGDSLFGPIPPWVFTENLRKTNPWWDGKPGPPLPPFKRWPFERLVRLLEKGMTPAVVLRGPRRVGKTVLLRQIMEHFLAQGVPPSRLLYVPFDELESARQIQEPILTVARWFEENILGRSINESAREGEPAYLFFDEVQNLDNWSPQIKNLVDNQAVRVLITGSSSLRIEAGRDSLAGRIATLEMGPLLLREIAGLRFGFSDSPIWGDNNLDNLLRPDFWHAAKEAAMHDAGVRWDAFQGSVEIEPCEEAEKWGGGSMKRGSGFLRLPGLLGVLALSVLLSGCVSGQFHVTVFKDGSAELEYRMAMDPLLLSFSDQKDPLAEMKAEAEKGGFTVSSYTEGNLVGFKAVKRVQDLKELPVLQSGMFKVKVESSQSGLAVKKGLFANTYKFNGNFDLTGMKQTGEGAELANAMISQMKLKFLLTLPVEPKSSNAASVADKGKTLEWVLIPGQTNQIYAEARVPNLTNIAMAIALGVAIVALLTVVVVKKFRAPRGQSA